MVNLRTYSYLHEVCVRAFTTSFCFYATDSIPTKYHWRFNFYAILNIRGFISFKKTFRKIIGLLPKRQSRQANDPRTLIGLALKHGMISDLLPHVAKIIIDHIGTSLPSCMRSDAPQADNLFRKPQDCHGREYSNCNVLNETARHYGNL